MRSARPGCGAKNTSPRSTLFGETRAPRRRTRPRPRSGRPSCPSPAEVEAQTVVLAEAGTIVEMAAAEAAKAVMMAEVEAMVAAVLAVLAMAAAARL